MKRTIVILSTIITLLVAGVLYGDHWYTDNREMISLEEAYAAQYPGDLTSVVVVDSITVLSL